MKPLTTNLGLRPFLASRRGSTLIELTIGMMVGMALAVASLSMVNQQLSFTRLTRDQAFLLEDCPMINNLLSRTLGRVDSYRIYSDLASAKAGGASLLAGGNALLLVFRDSLSRLQYTIIAGETIAGRVRLGVYNSADGTAWGNAPDWVISQAAADVDFFIDNGVLRVRLTGPNGDQITYSGHTQS